jgi:hypothetical protein
MSDNLEIKDLKDVIKFPNTKLKDHTGKQTLINSSVEKPFSFDVYESKLTVSGSASIELFNSKDDKDKANILGLPKQDLGDLELTPSITYSPENCWLKYSTSAGIKGSASHSIEELGFGIDVEAGLNLHSYREHTPHDKLGEALKKGLTPPKFIASEDDILSLKTNEAVAMETKGKLKISMKLSWSDVLTQNMSLFSRLLSVGELLNIKIDAEVSSSIDVTIDDYFSLIFSGVKENEDTLRIGIVRSSARGMDFSVGATFTASFSDPGTLKDVTGKMLDGIFEHPKEVVDKLKAATDISQLDESAQKVAKKIMSRLGLDSATTSIDELGTKIDKLEYEITKKLEKAIESKATLGAKYEYSRLTKEQALIQGVVPKSLIPDCHESALKGRLFELTDVLEDDSSGAKLERFFFQKSTTIKHAFGFNLGFGSWKAMSKGYSEIEFIENRNVQNRKKLSMLGIKGYKSTRDKDSRDFFVDFDAVMPNYSNYPVPAASEFEYALNVSHLREEARLDKDELFDVVENASVWGIVPQGELGETVNELWLDIDGASDVKLVRTMTIKHELFLKLLPLMSSFDSEKFAVSLAAALSPVGRGREEVKEVRNSPYLRKKLYTPLCLAFLDGKLNNHNSLAAVAHNHLKSEGYRKLAKWELDWKEHAKMNSCIAGAFRLHPSLRDDLINFSKGMMTLNDAIVTSKSHKEISKSFRMFDDLGEHDFYIRVLGNYLMRLVKHLPSEEDGFECSLSIEYKPRNSTQVEKLVISTR